MLNGYANPGGDATTGWFRYSTASPGTCNDTFGTRAPATGGAALGSGNSSVSFGQPITGLSPGVTYYYCAIARNSVATNWGAVQTFITPGSPTAATLPATSITNSSATLNGTGNPNRAATSGWFRYALTNPGTCDDKFGSRAPVTGSLYLGSDTSDDPYSQGITGLSGGTTYYYCAIVTSTEGTAFGAVMSFVTSGPATATTAPATSVTASSAILNGAGNPSGANALGWFRYSPTSPGSCNDTFGTRAPSSSGLGLGTGTTSTAFAQAVAGLSPGVTYYYCAIASNAYGTGVGAVLSFTTPATAPSVTTSGASSLTRTTGVLNGYANPGGDATTGWFRYSLSSPGTCNDTFGTRAPATGGAALGSGSSSVSFGQAITGLAPGVTYYYCAIAANSAGTAWGTVQSFITPAAPTAITLPASSIANSSATLNGAGNPNRAATSGWFRYALTNPGTCDDKFGSRAPVTGSLYLGSDTSDDPYSQGITGLSSGTTYYYCAIVASTEGTAFGAVSSFTTSGPPTATTAAASSVTSSSATLNGAGNPNGANALGWFRYSQTNPGACSDAFGTRAPSSSGLGLGTGTTSTAFAQPIGGLSPGVTYYYCAIANNSYGTGLGAVLSFTTPATVPSVTTSGASSLTRTTGVLNGYANPGGDATTGWFRYSTASPGTCNDTFGTRAPATGGAALGSGSSSVSFGQAITGLAPGVTYYYCALAANSAGTALGGVQTFITPGSPTAITLPAGSVTTSSATLNGSGNPNRAATSGWFRYSTTNPGTCDDKFGSRAPVTGSLYLGSDTSDNPYAQGITGLSSGTTYYYCAIVASTEGTAFGAVLPFTTSGVPAATTAAASSVTSSSATLNGAGNPNGANALGWFRYSPTDPGACSDTFGTRAPSSSGLGLGSGTTSTAFAQPIGGLSPGVTYYYCAIASNSYGTGLGAVLSFTTPATVPSVTTSGASSLTRTTGVLNGYANPGGDATTGWFRYSTASPGTCNDTFGTRAPATGGATLGAGSSSVSFGQAITGLAPGVTYYYCAIASNSVGTAWGGVQTFITPGSPTAATLPASNITNSSATLNGTGNPNRAATSGWFRYALTNPGTCDDKFGSRAPVTGSLYLGSDTSDDPYSQGITGLSSGTTYYYCAIVASTEGTALGTVQTFITSGAPTATTATAASVTATSATLNGAGTPNGANTLGWFRYSPTSPGSCNDTFGTRAPSSSGLGLGTGTTSVPFTQAIAGLTPATTYYYCAIANNTYGTGLGAVQSFTTPAMAPTVTTSSATSLTRTTGVLTAYANPGGDATTGWFRYSTASPGTCNDTFGTRAPATGGSALGSGNSSVTFTQAISGLAPATMYYYCALASNSMGTVLGTVLTFITPASPTAMTLPATAITNSSATLNGTGNPNRAATSGWFRYSLTNPGTCDDKFGSRAPVTGSVYVGSDTLDDPYSQGITGLSAGTTYYYCAIVASTEGTAFGAVVQFTTSGAAVATTGAVTSVTSTTATLTGTGNPNGASALGWFRYSATSPGSCNDTFGTRTPSSSGTALGAGVASVAFGQPITGLAPGVTYYYCAIASNTYGTGLGSLLSFTTPASPPTVSTDYPTGITTTLNGSANPNGAATTGWFRIATTSPGTCNDTFGTRIPTTSGTALGAGSSFVAFANPAPGLTPGGTYYYCAIAANALGTSFGVIRSFTAPMPPTVATLAATPVTATTATLNGSANPNGNSTTAWFRFSTSSPGTCNDVFGTRTPAAGGSALGSGTTATPFAEAIAGLSPATTYYFCAIASSAFGTSIGSVLSFTTPPSSVLGNSGPAGQSTPSLSPVTTAAATDIAAESAVLNGAADPTGLATTGWFRYDTTDPGSCSDTFGTRAPDKSGAELGAGASPVPYSQAVTGLAPGTTYYYCAIAESGQRTSFGAVLSLTTKAGAPRVKTLVPTDVVGDAAVLSGAVVPSGAAATGWFRYSPTRPESCSDSFGTRAPAGEEQPLGAGLTAVTYSVALSGLKAGTTYYYCAIASNAQGTTYGELQSFVAGVGAPGVTTEGTTDVAPSSGTLVGTVAENGSAATVWFRYGEVDPGTCDDSFASRVAAIPAETPLAAAAGPRLFSAPLSGLKPGVTYYYCAAASNQSGAKFGVVRSFTTLADPTAASANAVDPASAGGCSYRGRADGTPLALLTLLPLLGLLLRRRRRQGEL